MAPETGQIDHLDVKLIEALRDDPRVGLLEIARRVGVARGTVQARLRKLEERGVITGYGPEVEPSRMGYPIAAFVFVELNQGRLAEAAEAARACPEVLEVDAVSGDQDLICRVVARGTVQARLRKLEERGVITGYGPEVEPARMGYPIAAFVFVELNQGRLAEAAEAARAVPEVLEVDAVSGQQDLICRVVAHDTEHLQEIVNGLVASEAIQRCTSHIVLSRQVAPRTAPLLRSAAKPG